MDQGPNATKPLTRGSMASTLSLGSAASTALLDALGPRKIAVPETASYNATLGSYFTKQQEAMQPACFVLAESAQDVSAAVKILVEPGHAAAFAIRSGGHGCPPGFSNINGGVVIDLTSLKSIELSTDKSSVCAGVGATWSDVYEALDPQGLSVNGSRSSHVGIGGLTLGSGLSYTSPRYGWTCDAVSQFEVVLADGSLVEANPKTNADLLWALKGGSNNFGVVTRIKFDVFPQGPIWSGNVFSLIDNAPEVIDNFVVLNSPTSYDEYANIFSAFVYTSMQGGLALVTNLLQYTKEVDGIPPVFENFFKTPNIHNSTSVGNMAATTQATAATNPGGTRIINLVKTLISTKPVIQAIYDKWAAAYPAIKGVSNITFSLTLEPLPPAIYKRHAEANALGLENRTDALVVALIYVFWTDESDDALVHSTANGLANGIATAAEELGGLDPFLFLNYADKSQAVIESYGSANVRRLRQVRDKFDPKRVFTNQVPGGFKIPDS